MISELRALRDKATNQGPWTVTRLGLGYSAINGNGIRISGAIDSDDADLIVAAVNALPALLDVVEAAERLKVIRDEMEERRKGPRSDGVTAIKLVSREAVAWSEVDEALSGLTKTNGNTK